MIFSFRGNEGEASEASKAEFTIIKSWLSIEKTKLGIEGQDYELNFAKRSERNKIGLKDFRD